MGLVSRTEQRLGTAFEIRVLEENLDRVSLCFDELARIEAVYSRFRDDSDLSRLNRNLGIWQSASDEMIYLISSALDFQKKTYGYFDTTLKSVLDSWGYDREYSFKPKPLKDPGILESLKTPVSIDFKGKRVLLNKEIEFGGLGKGYALDRLKALLESHRVRHYYVNGGGDIIAKKGDNCDPWVILLEHPYDPALAIGKVELDDRSIAGSAPNRRRWGQYHHLINAKTKRPAQGVAAIFVIADSGMEADAYATALFTAGYEEGKRLSRKLPVEILIISSDNRYYQSEGFGAELFKG